MSAGAQTCEQFCTKPIGPNGQPGTEDSRACCPECDRVLDWICHDVLLSIRRHGHYCPPDGDVDDELHALMDQAGWRGTLERLLGDIGLPDPINPAELEGGGCS